MKKFLLRLFAIATIFSGLTYLVSCFTPYISPVDFWPFAFLAIAYPYLAFLLFLLLIVWFFIRRKVALALLLLLFVGYQNLFATIAINFPAAKDLQSKSSHSLRILTWNVLNFDNPSTYLASPESIRSKMFEYIEKSNADVVCMQEFTEHITNGVLSNTTEMLDLGYQYYYRTNDWINKFGAGKSYTGTAIFSKIPLIDTGKVLLGDPSNPEHIAFVDLKLDGKKLRVFSTHFKSYHLYIDTVTTKYLVYFHNDSTFLKRSSKLEKLKVISQDHAREADIIKAQLNKSPYPVIFTADMNSVPATYSYHTLARGLTDAFVKKGWGLGGTMDNLPVTLRIDVLLADKDFSIKTFHKTDIRLSDHYPQFMDVQWK